MPRMVGLARSLKIEWLDKTVDLVLEGMATETIKDELNQYLSFEIDSPTSLRKTRESLVNIWVVPSDGFVDVRTLALSLYSSISSDKLPLHWCMMAASYPIFADMCSLIGKVANVEESFTSAWIRGKIYESWGERSTLDMPIKNILKSLVGFGTLDRIKTGVYKVKPRLIEDARVIRLLILTVLSLGKKAYYEIHDLSRMPLLFPFSYNVTMELLYNMPETSISSFGGKMVVTGKA